MMEASIVEAITQTVNRPDCLVERHVVSRNKFSRYNRRLNLSRPLGSDVSGY